MQTVVGVGTQGQVPYYAANGSIVSATSSLTILQNGNVGIGTTSPATTFSVLGSGYVTGGLGVGLLNIAQGTISASTSYAIGTSTIITLPLTPNPDNVPNSNISLGPSALSSITPIHSTQYDTAVGFEALASLTTEDHDTALGAWSLNSVTNSVQGDNTALGIDSMRYMINGTRNTAVGDGTLTWSTTSNSDTAVGLNAMNFAGGLGNSAFGIYAMQSTVGTPVTGANNTAIGTGAQYSLAGAANQNTSVGAYSLNFATTASQNSALGFEAGYGITTGTYNTIIGTEVGYYRPITGVSNILIGTDSSTETYSGATTYATGVGAMVVAGSYDTCIGAGSCAATAGDGHFSTAVGMYALKGVTTGAQNVAIGYNAGLTITGGYYNTILGASAGSTVLTSGHDNILIGTGGNVVTTPTSNKSNFLNIGNTIYGTSIGSGGSIGIGSTTPYAKLALHANAGETNATLFAIGSSTAAYATSTLLSFSNTGVLTINSVAGGACVMGSGAGNVSCTSDARLKTNITTIPNALAGIEQLKGVTFNWADPTKDQQQLIGVIAQDVQKVFPQAVTTIDGYLAVDYAALVAPLIEAVKTLASEVDALKTTVAGFASSFSSQFIHGDTVEAGSLCVKDVSGATCITRAQLDVLLRAAGQQSSSPATPPAAPPSDAGTPPVTPDTGGTSSSDSGTPPSSGDSSTPPTDTPPTP